MLKYINFVIIEEDNYYLITKALNQNLLEDRNNFKKITKSQKYHHYKKLFDDLSFFNDKDIGNLKISPDNIFFTNVINENKDFELKLIDYNEISKKSLSSKFGT